MKIFISADMEGLAGTTDWNEVTKTSAEYGEFREQMTREVAAACDGAFEAGATKIVIKDAHSTARNLIASKLPKNTVLVRGWSRHPYLMMQEIDSSFDAAMMIGYHAMGGSGQSPLAHTISSARYSSIEVNGIHASEFLLNTYTAALEGVPVVFLSGDEGICREAEEVIPGISTVAVKRGMGASTVNMHPEDAVNRIRIKSCESLKRDTGDLKFELPEFFSIKINFSTGPDAYKASFYPGVKQVSDKSIMLETENYFDVLRMLIFV